MLRVLPTPTVQSRRFFLFFVLAELVLAMAIPFVAIEGYHTLLASRAGTFVVEPTSADPGWKAFVDPTPVVAVVEVSGGAATGVSLVVESSQAVVLVPGALTVDGTRLDQRPPDEAVSALAAALRLRLHRAIVMDEAAWKTTLGTRTYSIDNPDPVTGPDGQVLVGVGEHEVGAGLVGLVLSLPASGTGVSASMSVMPRRRAFWGALVADPPGPGSELGVLLESLSGSEASVVPLPVAIGDGAVSLDGGAEELIREIVSFPAGTAGGERLGVEIIDRTGRADLEAVAVAVAAMGAEVRSIANAPVFSEGPTELGASDQMPEALREELNALAARLGAATVWGSGESAPVEPAVTQLVIGNDFELTELS